MDLSPAPRTTVEASPSTWTSSATSIGTERNKADGTTSGIATSNASSSERKSPPTKRRKQEKERSRVSRACDRCKSKKTRCTGRCPCTLCSRAGLPCEFTASYTRGRLPAVLVDEAAMTMSANSSTTLSEPPTRVPNAPNDATSTAFSYTRPDTTPSLERPIFGAVGRLNGRTDAVAQDAARTSPEPAQEQTDSQGHYVGSSSGVSFLLRIQKRLHQDSSLSHNSSIFAFGDSPLPEFDPTFFVMPPKPDAQRLVERYFDYAAPTHRFLHRPTIENLLHEFYETQGDMRSRDDAAARTALLLIVFAQAQAYMPPGSTTKENSARYFFAAEHQLLKERGAVRLASVQARLLQCFYLLTQSRINHCWSLFGTTAHLALAIGLNRGRRYDPAGSVDYVELENRRRTFWVAYSLDKYLSAALGRPRTYKDEDIDQELPSVVNDNDIHPHHISSSPSKTPSHMMAPVEHIKLTRIVSLVLRDLYPIRPPSLSVRMELSAKYTKDLDIWRAALSPFLDATGFESSLLIPIFQRQRGVLNLAYYHAMLLIHRPFLLSDFANLTQITQRQQQQQQQHTSMPQQQQRPTIDTSASIASCLDAAMNIVRVVDDVFASSNLFRAFWFTQYYAFCAVVVLYIYRIQQQQHNHRHRNHPATAQHSAEAYFAAGQKCQRQLETISESDCLARRYCLVLEELRLEAVRQTSSPLGLSAASMDVVSAPAPAQRVEQAVDATMRGISTETPGFYGTPIPPTPVEDRNMFAPDDYWSSSVMADLTSWGQFDSLVTAGIGIFDAGPQEDNGLGFGFGL